jgi:hypothetical protein
MPPCQPLARPTRAARLTRLATAALALVASASIAPAQTPPAADRAARTDRFSFANADAARVTHVALDLRADFDALPRAMAIERVQALDRAFRRRGTTNSEVLCAWLQLAVAHRYDPAVPALERFLTSQGRRKFVQPLFESLVASDWGRPIAARGYAQARGTYHPLTALAVDRLFGK